MVIASEEKQRRLSVELATTEVMAEAAPFSFSMKNGGEEVRPSPHAYIPHLAAKVMELLDQNARYAYQQYIK